MEGRLRRRKEYTICLEVRTAVSDRPVNSVPVTFTLLLALPDHSWKNSFSVPEDQIELSISPENKGLVKALCFPNILLND